MYHSKVILCGVNTSKLKVLTEEEKRILMKRVREGDEGRILGFAFDYEGETSDALADLEEPEEAIDDVDVDE